MTGLLVAVILGLVEGITEFLPVSSTGHLIIAGDLLGFDSPSAPTFEIFIQLGAVFAVVWHYRRRLWEVGLRAGGPVGREFLLPLFIAFLPAAVVGLLLHGWLKAHLFHPLVVAGALVVGGIVILILERIHFEDRIFDAERMPARTALGIGLAQLLALIPGTSRSAATILGGYALGCSRKAATEFSFLLSIPVLGSATLYDLYQSRDLLSGRDVPMFAVGTAVAFITALVVIRGFLKYVSGHDFRPFAWYRIGFGLVVCGWYLWR
ncbi:MAG: undecaprenyl-diphosphate phosphatase [Gemmatimonadota bacterium]